MPASHVFPLECEQALAGLELMRDSLRATVKRQRIKDQAERDREELSDDQRDAIAKWDPWGYFNATNLGVMGPNAPQEVQYGGGGSRR